MTVCVWSIDCIVDRSKIVDPYRDSINGACTVSICFKGIRVDSACEKPREKIPDTCALRLGDICSVCITLKGIQVTITSTIVLIAVKGSRKPV